MAAALVCGAAAFWLRGLPPWLANFTPARIAVPAYDILTDQLIWAAWVGAAFFLLRATGFFRWKPVLAARRALTAGEDINWLGAIFLVAFGVRLLYALTATPPPISDEVAYDRLAAGLAAGVGYGAAGAPEAYRPIGYPAFLASCYVLFGRSYIPVIIYQSLLGAATAALTVLIGKVFAPRGAARAAGLLVALLPSQVAYAARLFPQVPFLFAILLATYLIVAFRKWWGAAAAGAVIGWGTLIYPLAAVFPIIVLTVDVFNRLPWKRIVLRVLLAAALTAAVVAPWSYRNGRVFHAFVPISTNSGVNLWIGNNPHATGGFSYPLSRTNPVYMTKGELAADRVGRELAWFFMKDQTTNTVLLSVPKFVFLYADDISAFQYELLPKGVKPAIAAQGWRARLAQGCYALFGIAFVWGLLRLGRSRKAIPRGGWAYAALLVWPVILTLEYLVFFGSDRFHFPMIPFMAIVGGVIIADAGDSPGGGNNP